MVGGIHTEGMRRGTTADTYLSNLRGIHVNPMLTAGVGGTAVFGGFVQSLERDPTLFGRLRYKTYSDIEANLAIVGLGVRYRQDLVSKPIWSVEPADESRAAKEAADFVEDVFFDLATPWNRVVRRMEMFKFHGFDVHEWTAKRRDDGKIGFLDFEVRPQVTIERWDLDVFGTVNGVIQRSPQTGQYHYIPREKMVHLVDDSVMDSPEGMGIFRHLVESARRIQRYRQLEGFGFETDLRGVPIASAPIAELQEAVKAGMPANEFESMLAPLTEFMSAHIKSPDSGILLDSSTYRDKSASATPSQVKKWAMDLLQGGTTALEAIGKAIEREALWIAALLGVEHMLIGGSSRGSQALSKDKSTNLATQIDADVAEIVRAVERDALMPLWTMNGFDPKLMPSFSVEKLQWRDIAEVTAALQALALAGAPMTPDDPAVPQLRDMLGLLAPDMTKVKVDASINRMRNVAPTNARSGGAANGATSGQGETTTPPAPKSKSATNGTASK